MMEGPVETWIAGQLALSLLAVDPAGLGGAHVRARAGPVRDACLAALPAQLPPRRRISPAIADGQLYSGIDLAATLATGRLVRSAGMLAQPSTLVLGMAERCGRGLAARLALALDGGTGHALILLDEGADDDEVAPAALCERVAFKLDLDGLRGADLATIALDEGAIDVARARLADVKMDDGALDALTVTAARFGIASMRAPLLARAAARAHAALMDRDRVTEDDLQLAVQLVYAHRATMLPDTAEDTPDDAPEPEDQNTPEETPGGEDEDDSLSIPDELLIEAVRAILPDGLLPALRDAAMRKSAKGSDGAGAAKAGRHRGRPLPSRPGQLRGGAKIDIIATLRAAAPWQPVRRKTMPDAPGLIIRPADIYVRRYQERSDRLIVFAVDASGSAAMARLAEAKGAVELMLAEAYASRDHVALIAFRGDGAELILPPTRSLVQTKRRLAGLPGGGGTPLAAGLRAAFDLARRMRGQGMSPALAVLTDGRANVPLPGRTGRAAAAEDATAMARLIATLSLPAAVVDTGVRPTRDLAALAHAMGGTYVPLPRADSRGLSKAVGAALGG